MQRAELVVSWLDESRLCRLTTDSLRSLQTLAIFRAMREKMAPATFGERVRMQGDSGTSEVNPRVTPREAQILGWIAAGKSDWEIGRILNISAKTVNFHVERAKRKFGVATRIQAVLAAMRNGAIQQ
jgi:DNA-binding CsgD family transcriptional regulator